MSNSSYTDLLHLANLYAVKISPECCGRRRMSYADAIRIVQTASSYMQESDRLDQSQAVLVVARLLSHGLLQDLDCDGTNIVISPDGITAESYIKAQPLQDSVIKSLAESLPLKSN